VTQRLNQIENGSPLPRSRQNTATLVSDLNRRASTRSTDADSLLDLYESSPIARVPVRLTRSGWTSPVLPLIPEVSPQVSEITKSHNHSPLSTYTAANNDMKLGSLVELLQDQATKHYYHTNDIRDQIASLHNEIHGMFEELKVAVGDQPADQIVKFAETVNNSMVELERKLREVKSEGEEGLMEHIGEKLDSIHADIRSIKDNGAPGGGVMIQTAVRNLEELRTTIQQQDGGSRMILQELEKLRLALGVTDEPGDVVLQNLGSSSAAKGSTVLHPNLTEVNAKLDLLLNNWKESAGGIGSALNHQEVNNIQQVSTLLTLDDS
jgi:archaellum component FlaC